MGDEDRPEASSTSDVEGVTVSIIEGGFDNAALGSRRFGAVLLMVTAATMSNVSFAALSETAAFPEAISAILPFERRLISGLAFRATIVDKQKAERQYPLNLEGSIMEYG